MNDSHEPTICGCRARGNQCHVEIIDVTLAVVTRDGATGVTHRTVAKLVGITTSVSPYYSACDC